MRISDWSSDVCSSDLVGAEQLLDAAGELTRDRGLARLHLVEIDLEIRTADAVRTDLVLHAMPQLRRFQQCFRGNAASVEAGAAECGGVVLVQPSVDAGGLETALQIGRAPWRERGCQYV